MGGAELTRYHRIGWDGAKIEALFVDLFLEAHQQPPQQIILDLDATDDPLHGDQDGRFFHGYYDCYCYLPLYIFCGTHLLAVKQRCANIDASAGAVEETDYNIDNDAGLVHGSPQPGVLHPRSRGRPHPDTVAR